MSNSTTASDCFITSAGMFLPGEPISNDEMENVLGRVGDSPSRIRKRILNQNKILTRYYAINDRQETMFSNSQMAANAIRNAIQQSTLDLKDVELLVASTSQGDLPLPGFAVLSRNPSVRHNFTCRGRNWWFGRDCERTILLRQHYQRNAN